MINGLIQHITVEQSTSLQWVKATTHFISEKNISFEALAIIYRPNFFSRMPIIGPELQNPGMFIRKIWYFSISQCVRSSAKTQHAFVFPIMWEVVSTMEDMFTNSKI